jgi:3-methyladenine DNA glycosylase AlkC
MVKKWICDVQCPWCDKMLSVNKEVEVISPMIPAEKEERYYSERLAQTTLDQHKKEPSEDE